MFETNYFGTVRMLLAITPIMQAAFRQNRQHEFSRRPYGGLAATVTTQPPSGRWGAERSPAFEMAEFGVRVALYRAGLRTNPARKKGTPPPPDSHYMRSLGGWGNGPSIP